MNRFLKPGHSELFSLITAQLGNKGISFGYVVQNMQIVEYANVRMGERMCADGRAGGAGWLC